MEEPIIVNEDKGKRNVPPEMQGTGKIRKPSASRKFAETFLAEDANDAGRYIMQDVLVPIIKDAIGTVLHSTVDALFGGKGSSYTGRNNRGSNYIPYDKRSRGRILDPRDDDRGARVRHGVQDIEIPTKPIAEAIIDDLTREIRDYGEVSVNTYYDTVIEYMPNISKELDREFTDNDWGWVSVRDVYSQRLMGGGYRIVLPRPRALK